MPSGPDPPQLTSTRVAVVVDPPPCSLHGDYASCTFTGARGCEEPLRFCDSFANMDEEAPDDLCDEPLKVDAYHDAVVIFGPRNVNLAMTADAAAASLPRLILAIAKARLAAYARKQLD
jgi:hypothetical protein